MKIAVDRRTAVQVKKPGKGHPHFRILGPKGPGRTVRHEELDAINREYREGRLSLPRAHELVRILAKRLEPKPVASWLPENEAIATAFWRERIAPKKKNVAPQEARRRVFWATRQLGATPLLTSDADTLYAALSHLTAEQKRRAASVLNSILRWRGLEKTINTERVTKDEPAYLTLEEILSFSLPHREWQLCVLAAFATGARYGELFTIVPTSFRESGTHVFIGRQIKRGGEVAETKNRKSGTVFIIPELRDAVREWAALPPAVRLEMRRRGIPGGAFKLAAWKALQRSVTFHNLRHSYAKLMLSRGATLEDLRKWLRDRMSTVELYYLNWVETSAEMQSSVRRFG
jgi:integrase